MPINLFDANFYRGANSDLAGFNDAQALSHFQTFGLNEGRQFSPFVDLGFYRASNNDLASLNNSQLLEHLQTFGVNEGRQFSPFVDLGFYQDINADLASLNNSQLLEHLQTFGVNEERLFSPFVDLGFYQDSNADLSAFNNRQLLEHLEIFGVNEGRQFSRVIEPRLYGNINSDLVVAGFNNEQLLEHFEIFGVNEGLVGSSFFDADFYLAINADLRALNFNNQQALEHFVIFGFREGRQGSPGLILLPDPGDTPNTALDIGTVSTSRSFTGFVGTGDLADFYRFNVASTSNFNLTLDSFSADANVTILFDRNNDRLFTEFLTGSFNPGTSPEMIGLNLSAGTYIVAVRPIDFDFFANNTTNYTLTVSATPAPAPSPAPTDPGSTLVTPLDIGTVGTTSLSFTDSVGMADTDDFYRFNLASTSNFNLRLDGLSEGSFTAEAQLIHDANNNGVVDGNETFSSSRSIPIIPATISNTLGADNYFIRVRNISGSNTNYTLTVSANPAPVTTPSNPGNSIPMALDIGNVSTSLSFTDFVGVADAEDFYRFNLAGTSNFILTLDSSSFQSDGDGFFGRADAGVEVIFDFNNNGVVDGGERVESSSFNGGNFSDVIIRTLGASVSSNYFIRVFGDNTNYTLTVSADPAPETPPGDPDNNFGNARDIGTLSTNRSVFNNFVGIADTADFYRFNLASTSTFNLALEGLTDSANVQLIRDSNNNGMIDSGESLASRSGNFMSPGLISQSLAAGTYFIQVTPSGVSPRSTHDTNYTLTAFTS